MDKKAGNTRISNQIFGIFIAIVVISLFYIVIGQGVYQGQRALYRDDLGTYNVLMNEETTVWQEITNTVSNKTRYVLNIILMLFFHLVDGEVKGFERIDTFLLIWNIIVAINFFIIIFWLLDKYEDNKRSFYACITTLMFGWTRLSYYHFTEVLGIMESLALILTLYFLILLMKDNFKFTPKYWIANLIYFICIYIHERYFVLVGVLAFYVFIGILLNKSVTKYIKNILLIVVMPIFFFLMRFLVLGKRVMDGTGGTSVTDSFSLSTFFKHMLYQLGYLLGINAPNNAYLNGIDPQSVPLGIYFLSGIIVVLYIITFIKFLRRIEENKFLEISKLLVIFCTMLCSIISSSVTIRVEMRWVYVSYAIFLLSFVFMLSKLELNVKSYYMMTFLSISVICSFFVENFYRSKWDNLYYWNDRELSSSLYEVLDNENKQIDKLTIIMEPEQYIFDEVALREICESFQVTIGMLNITSDISDVNGSGIVLLKETGANRFINITSIISSNE